MNRGREKIENADESRPRSAKGVARLGGGGTVQSRTPFNPLCSLEQGYKQTAKLCERTFPHRPWSGLHSATHLFASSPSGRWFVNSPLAGTANVAGSSGRAGSKGAKSSTMNPAIGRFWSRIACTMHFESS